MSAPHRPTPPLAMQAQCLRNLLLPESGARVVRGGSLLQFDFTATPYQGARDYRCRLEKPRRGSPSVYVLSPDLEQIAPCQRLPHVYRFTEGRTGVTELCLYYPKGREWQPSMWLAETLVPWTFEWLRYFELWLVGGQWLGGGEHPSAEPRRRYGVRRRHA